MYKEKDPFHFCILLKNEGDEVEFIKAHELEPPVRKIKPTPLHFFWFVMVFFKFIDKLLKFYINLIFY